MPNDYRLADAEVAFLGTDDSFLHIGYDWSILVSATNVWKSSTSPPHTKFFSSPCIWQWLTLHIAPSTCYCCNNRMFKGQCAVVIEWGKLWNWQHNLNLECGLPGSSGGPWISCLALRWCPISSYLNRPHNSINTGGLAEPWRSTTVTKSIQCLNLGSFLPQISSKRSLLWQWAGWRHQCHLEVAIYSRAFILFVKTYKKNERAC